MTAEVLTPCTVDRIAVPQAFALALSLVLLQPSALGARQLVFTATVLPPVETDLGPFDYLRPVALNNRGEVAGTAFGPYEGSPTFDHSIAFLYEPGRGAQGLDPYDSLFSSALFVDEEGRVLGDSCCRPGSLFQFFLSSNPPRPNKANRLSKGSDGWFRDEFHPTALTNQGDIAGFSTSFRDATTYRRAPVLNLRGRGWIDLSELDNRLDLQTSTHREVLRLNRFGDFVMPTASDGVLGSFAGNEPIEIVPPNLDATIGQLSDAGEIVGEIHVPSFKYDPAGPERAFLFTPSEGLFEIHGDRFLSSRAVWITSTGTVGGFATKKRSWQANDRLFTYSRTRHSRGLTVTNLRRELHRTHPKRKFGSASALDMNQSLQFIGEIQTRAKGDGDYGPYTGEVIHYLIDPQKEMIDIQEVLEDNGLEVEIIRLVDLNDRGQVLIDARRPRDRLRMAILLTRE